MPTAQPPATHEDITTLACHLWEEHGAPIGSPAVDWEHAEQERARERAERNG